jgi:large subunit ribosomal protein L2
MPSGEIRKISMECFATIGQVGNLDHENVSIRKAGPEPLARDSGRTSACVAMNPVDHPLGGGEGQDVRADAIRCRPWGLPTKGYKTRNRKSTDQFIVQRRKK